VCPLISACIQTAGKDRSYKPLEQIDAKLADIETHSTGSTGTANSSSSSLSSGNPISNPSCQEQSSSLLPSDYPVGNSEASTAGTSAGTAATSTAAGGGSASTGSKKFKGQHKKDNSADNNTVKANTNNISKGVSEGKYFRI